MTDNLQKAKDAVKETIENTRDLANEEKHRLAAEAEKMQAEIDKAKREARIKNAEQ